MLQDKLNLIEIGRNRFMLGRVLVTSCCGITAECSVNKSVKTTAAHICAFCETETLWKNAKCDAYGLQKKISPYRIFFKLNFTDSYYSIPNSFLLHRPGSGSSISSKYNGVTRSLDTRKTLEIPKLLKCMNKAQPEPCYKKTQLRSWSQFIFTRAPQPEQLSSSICCRAMAGQIWPEMGNYTFHETFWFLSQTRFLSPKTQIC